MSEIHPVLQGMVLSFLDALESRAYELGVYNGERRFRKESVTPQLCAATRQQRVTRLSAAMRYVISVMTPMDASPVHGNCRLQLNMRKQVLQA